MSHLIEILNDGGVYITYPILILLLVMVVLFVRAMTGKADFDKSKSLIASISWFCIAWGYLGRTIGLISAFDKIQAAGDISPSMFASHLKMALVGPLVAILVFAIARLGIIILVATRKNTVKTAA